ncbi:protein of unknown function [Methanocaldococcus lauensis]|uniref:Uncharacterized protein n=1 Tax=Methanocaldococcus lauensis TaxID=2546128 RepID=A0A8D6PSD7_9EURY|nr:hypothetical protein [Methanocaldococcus lauensis]CAB3287588.1 protein of unknown function [Methanocaldococcus lauensis]
MAHPLLKKLGFIDALKDFTLAELIPVLNEVGMNPGYTEDVYEIPPDEFEILNGRPPKKLTIDDIYRRWDDKLTLRLERIREWMPKSYREEIETEEIKENT